MLHSYIHTHMCVFICTYTVYSMYMDAFTQPHINMSVCVYIYRKRETEREKRERERDCESGTQQHQKRENTHLPCGRKPTKSCLLGCVPLRSLTSGSERAT